MTKLVAIVQQATANTHVISRDRRQPPMPVILDFFAKQRLIAT
jgi:hypothetical protein